ncbi:hypothetical protein EPN90_04610, partial [Patescibacteria group bacterium]
MAEDNGKKDDEEDEDEDNKIVCPDPDDNPNCETTFELPATYKGDPEKALCRSCLELKRERNKRNREEGGRERGQAPAQDKREQGEPKPKRGQREGKGGGFAAAGAAVGGAAFSAVSPSAGGKDSFGTDFIEVGRTEAIAEFVEWAVDSLPESFLDALRRAPLGSHSYWVLRLGNLAWERLDTALGVPKGVSDFRRDALAMIAVNLRKRLTGQPATKSEEQEIRKAAEEAVERIKRLPKFVVIERDGKVDDKVHHVVCLEVPVEQSALHDKKGQRIREAIRHRHLTFEEWQLQGLQPCPKCARLIEKLIMETLAAEEAAGAKDPKRREVKKGENRRSKELLATPLGQRVLQRVRVVYENDPPGYARALQYLARGLNTVAELKLLDPESEFYHEEAFKATINNLIVDPNEEQAFERAKGQVKEGRDWF